MPLDRTQAAGTRAAGGQAAATPAAASPAAAAPADRAQARQHYQAAVAAEEQADLPAAVAALTAALALDDSRAGWHHRLGKLYARQRRWREAVAACEQALAREPDRPIRHYWLGRARERCWDLAGARAAYAAAVRLAPERAEWAERLAAVEAAAGEFRPYQGMLIAHRGRAGGAAENTIDSLPTVPAFVSGVEVDVRLSRDGVPVLMHDRWLDRTTGGEGEVAGCTVRQLARWAVPTLADYLAACAGRGFRRILVDVKSATPDALAAVAEVVSAAPVAGVCVVMVRDEAELAQARKVSDELRLGCFGTTVDNLDLRLAAAHQHRAELLLTALGSRRYLEHRAVVGAARAAGVAAGASTINTRQALEAARVDGCELLMTDVSDQLAHFTGAAGR